MNREQNFQQSNVAFGFALPLSQAVDTQLRNVEQRSSGLFSLQPAQVEQEEGLDQVVCLSMN